MNLKQFFKIALSALLLAGLILYLDLDAIAERLLAIDPLWFLLACLLLIAGQLLSALRWAWLARGLGMEVDARRKTELYFLGMFLSLFLPSIIGGDVARAWLMAKGHVGEGWKASASVFLERLNGLYGITLVVTLCMLFLDLPQSWWLLWIAAIAVLWLLLFSRGYWLRQGGKLRLSERIPASLRELPLDSVGFRGSWWRALLLTLVFQFLIVLAHISLGFAVGLELSWAAYGFIVCVVALASAIPISFNGFGIREGGYVALAIYFGGSGEAAAAMAMLWVLVLVVAALPGGIVLWRLGGTAGISDVRSAGRG